MYDGLSSFFYNKSRITVFLRRIKYSQIRQLCFDSTPPIQSKTLTSLGDNCEIIDIDDLLFLCIIFFNDFMRIIIAQYCMTSFFI